MADKDKDIELKDQACSSDKDSHHDDPHHHESEEECALASDTRTIMIG